jgi:hypothetical protein
MATRSRIGIELPNGQARSIYIHNDGYPSGVGQDLKNFIKDFMDDHLAQLEGWTIGDLMEDFMTEGDRSTFKLSYKEMRDEYSPSMDSNMDEWDEEVFSYLVNCETGDIQYRIERGDWMKLP